MDVTSITPSPEALKALTHPLRLRMLGLLRIDGPATATTLATRLGLNTGATSYHLRQLERHGFVAEDTARGNARDRWWRAAHQSTTTDTARPADPADAETLEAYLQSVAVVMTQTLQRSVEELGLLPPAWSDATTYSDWVIKLTPARAKALVERLAEVLHAEPEQEDDDEAVQYVVQLNGFPYPGRVGGAEE
ncbi:MULTISPECIES: winged helix-turn-helix domain-containing protein [unclassified Nocardioides]|jgi:predicted ArsR family transcriptional regulator|uniref:winged helix-turn-helix domain-containing protein n=1 Tax=Nocardioides sp. URHA0032 TaxID=1380388 RepID=UPI0006856F74|nr:helix-turn-helix domain-containing protein [Nocardioides sp. URHA0032]